MMPMQTRWLAGWKDSGTKPAIYHCVSRVVDRRLVFGPDERERFRTCMRMYEAFSGCRVLAYCVMSNHFHILLEVPPMPAGGLSDEEFARRLGALYGPGEVREVMEGVRDLRARGLENEAAAAMERHTYRMHDLSEFMKGLLVRFTMWFNRRHGREGTLWERRFKSVIVESGTAARTMAAYIDLNPVRAGMVGDPADYRWSSCGEAVGGGPRGSGRMAREGLVRALRSADGVGFEAKHWPEVSREYRALMSLALERKPGRSGRPDGPAPGKAGSGGPEIDASLARMLSRRVRYFTDGAVIGSRGFVDAVFRGSRGRFGPKRRDGARKMRGAGAPAAGTLWSLRDLRKDIGG
jgi:REP element-mobilizing transposase RayT